MDIYTVIGILAGLLILYILIDSMRTTIRHKKNMKRIRAHRKRLYNGQ